MRAVALNCSPRKGKATVNLILQPFLKGLDEGGADVELLTIGDLDIRPWRGNRDSWFKHPGEVGQDDDMPLLLGLMKRADLWVFASGIYADAVSAQMITVMERLVALVEPKMIDGQGITRHGLRRGVKKGKAILIATSAHWDMEDFDLPVSHFERFCGRFDRTSAGALLRPHAPALPHLMWLGKPTDSVLDGALEAGRQLAKTGEIPKASLKAVSAPLLAKRTYIRHMNEEFKKAQQAIEEAGRSPEDDELQIVTQSSPFTFKHSRDARLQRLVVDAVNSMGGIGEGAEERYRQSVGRIKPKAAPAIVLMAKELDALPEDQYLSRWSLVHLISELEDDSSVPHLDRIARSKIPAEKSKLLHQFSTRAEELLIRTTAVDGITRLARKGVVEATKGLLELASNKVLSIQRAAVQGYLEVGGRTARKELKALLPEDRHFLLDIERVDVKAVPQAKNFETQLRAEMYTPPDRGSLKPESKNQVPGDVPRVPGS